MLNKEFSRREVLFKLPLLAGTSFLFLKDISYTFANSIIDSNLKSLNTFELKNSLEERINNVYGKDVWNLKMSKYSSFKNIIMIGDVHPLSQEEKFYNHLIKIMEDYSDSFGLEGCVVGENIQNLLQKDDQLANEFFGKLFGVKTNVTESTFNFLNGMNFDFYGLEDKTLLFQTFALGLIWSSALDFWEKPSLKKASHFYSVKVRSKVFTKDLDIPDYSSRAFFEGNIFDFLDYVNCVGNEQNNLVDKRSVFSAEYLSKIVGRKNFFLDFFMRRETPFTTAILYGLMHADLMQEIFDKTKISYIDIRPSNKTLVEYGFEDCILFNN